ncbi:hypothetical protein, conserved [Plasmodium gonderi]|uniref:SDE2-like domain-containing protein n=1 Tax=Plasmodium gonderi TaxID=77519 RepID=A0A1Y1JIC8_PLAGO|nr:hypothetical protein, conserved [Plasmodium gonderi]GAW81990.1 hypothetical protein, conserved [Plasmodium gonderi]
MTSNYIIHIGNNIVNKRLKIYEYLNKYERRILEKNANAFFYILINLIFDVPIERFRLVINRKYIFLKKKKKIDTVFNITKKLLILNNISIKKRFKSGEEDEYMGCAVKTSYVQCINYFQCFNDSHYTKNSPSIIEHGLLYPMYKSSNILSECTLKDLELSQTPTLCYSASSLLLDNANKKHNLFTNEKKDTSHHSIMSDILIKSNPEKLIDSKRFFYEFEEDPFQNTRYSTNYLNHIDNRRNEYKKEIKKKLSSYNSFHFKEIKNKLNEFKWKSNEEYYYPKKTTTYCDSNLHKQNSENNYCEKKSIILINKNENKSGINIFDEFLDIYLLFRLRGGKGGFGANLRNKKKKKKKKKKSNLDDASRNARGTRTLVDTIIKTTEILAKKKKHEQMLIEKLNTAAPFIHRFSYDSSDELTNNNNQTLKSEKWKEDKLGGKVDGHDLPEEHQADEENAQPRATNNQRNHLHDIVYNGIVQERKIKDEVAKEEKKKKEKTKKKIDKDNKMGKDRNLKSIENMYTCL